VIDKWEYLGPKLLVNTIHH